MIPMERADNSPVAEPDLVAAAQQGDTRAFEWLVDKYRRSLHAYCYRMSAVLGEPVVPNNRFGREFDSLPDTHPFKVRRTGRYPPGGA
jgi:hypothetical protein